MYNTFLKKLKTTESHTIAKALLWFLILLGVAYGYYRITYKTVPERVYDIVQSGSLERCDQFEGKIENDENYYTVCRNNIVSNHAVDEMDVLWCEQLDNVLMSRDECVQTVITKALQEKRSADICNSVKNGDMRAWCNNQFK